MKCKGAAEPLTREEVRARIEEIGIIPAIRVGSRDDALFAANAVLNGGIPVVELTMNVPDVLQVIAELSATFPQAVVGAGTILDKQQAKDCADAGAAFLTSPGLDSEIMEFAKERNIVSIPGALTATEVMLALREGGDFIKIFPCAQVGGPAYIRALKGPFPHVCFIASGGVTQQTALDFVRSGAAVLGIGEELIPHEAIRTRNTDWIRELARRFLGLVKDARVINARRAHSANKEARS